MWSDLGLAPMGPTAEVHSRRGRVRLGLSIRHGCRHLRHRMDSSPSSSTGWSPPGRARSVRPERTRLRSTSWNRTAPDRTAGGQGRHRRQDDRRPGRRRHPRRGHPEPASGLPEPERIGICRQDDPPGPRGYPGARRTGGTHRGLGGGPGIGGWSREANLRLWSWTTTTATPEDVQRQVEEAAANGATVVVIRRLSPAPRPREPLPG